MPLTSGTKIGIYEVNSLLGVGGMGEVYRSLDSKLGRQVALKVLPTSVAIDDDRLARFGREAKLLAALNHPNIAAIYGLEDSGATHALVMELVEGPTLADRLKSGPISSDEALPIAKQICEALEYAHERGIVHRDLKPANVKVTLEGTAKVLDFGLAKALENEIVPVDLSSSPTMSRLATQAGVILGTAAYMSPEQARGKSVDRRADIWAFGCLLYEMLTGKMAFSGETVSDTLAAIIKEQPDWSLLPASTSPRIRVLIQRCLQKDPRQRLQAIGDARIAIEEVLCGAPDPASAAQPAAPIETSSPVPAWRRLLPWGVAAMLGAGLLLSLLTLRSSPPSALKPIFLNLSIPIDQKLDLINGPAFVISPDGSRVAYVIQDTASGSGILYIRELDQNTAVRLDAVGLAAAPFFSPDSQWVGFFGDGKLKKVSVHGGAPIILCEVSGYRGGAWGPDGTIVFPNQFTSPLYRIPSTGGTPTVFTHLDATRSDITHRWPQFLPGGKSVLFTASSNNNFFAHASVVAAPLDTGLPKVLVENAYFGRYLPGGYLAYMSQGVLFVVPFDANALKVTGTAIPAVQGVNSDLSNGGVQFSVAETGTAVYLSGGTQNLAMNIVELDRKGDSSVLIKNQADAASPRMAPDGKRVAFENGPAGIWVHDLARGTTTPIAPNTVGANFPIWSPDGQRITYSHPDNTARGPGQRIFWRRSDGTEQEEALTPESAQSSYPASWSPDGKVLAFEMLSPKDGSCCDIWTVTLDASGKPQPPKLFIESINGVSGRSLAGPEFSPDGRWVAYVSTESGAPQVNVLPFPGPGGKWQVSTDGGVEPRWARKGHELYYLHGSQLFAVPYTEDKNSFQPGKPQMLFENRFEARAPYTSYDTTPDGQHFVAIQAAAGRPATHTDPTVVINWIDEVKRTVIAGQSTSK
jgi:serine/threonine-protein kinase